MPEHSDGKPPADWIPGAALLGIAAVFAGAWMGSSLSVALVVTGLLLVAWAFVAWVAKTLRGIS